MRVLWVMLDMLEYIESAFKYIVFESILFYISMQYIRVYSEYFEIYWYYFRVY